MLLFVGLGNPRPSDAGNRHNVGFMALDRIAGRHGFQPWRSRFRGALSEGAVGGVKVLALKPMTYMNLSGEAVGEMAHFYKLAPEAVVVFHDELALAPGKVKVKLGGGSAGHNGLRSIDQHLGSDYKRVRIGIGHPGDKALVHPYVLRDFDKEERVWLATLLDAIADAAPLLVKGDDGEFMNRCHLALNPPKPKPPRAAKADGGDKPPESAAG
jgi:PTH1 family peptidyl-tRNA hydrolase